MLASQLLQEGSRLTSVIWGSFRQAKTRSFQSYPCIRSWLWESVLPNEPKKGGAECRLVRELSEQWALDWRSSSRQTNWQILHFPIREKLWASVQSGQGRSVSTGHITNLEKGTMLGHTTWETVSEPSSSAGIGAYIVNNYLTQFRKKREKEMR